MGRRIVVMKLICSLGHCECDRHTIQKLSQRRLTADWLDPRESDCSRMHSNVSSDWLPRYIKVTRTLLEVFKMAGHLPDSLRNFVPCETKDGVQAIFFFFFKPSMEFLGRTTNVTTLYSCLYCAQYTCSVMAVRPECVW